MAFLVPALVALLSDVIILILRFRLNPDAAAVEQQQEDNCTWFVVRATNGGTSL